MISQRCTTQCSSLWSNLIESNLGLNNVTYIFPDKTGSQNILPLFITHIHENKTKKMKNI